MVVAEPNPEGRKLQGSISCTAMLHYAAMHCLYRCDREHLQQEHQAPICFHQRNHLGRITNLMFLPLELGHVPSQTEH